jgi:hypothetical protein
MTNYKNQTKKFIKNIVRKEVLNFLKKFKDFMEFLEIDFYDWTRENLRQYFRDRKK